MRKEMDTGNNKIKIDLYDNFPLWIPFIAILISIIGYILGAFILSGFGIIFSILYLFYCLGMEMMIIFRSCKDCWYYGRICGLGKGKIAPLFVKKGNAKRFVDRDISFIDLIPDFMVMIFPLIGGVILLVLDFSIVLLGLMIILFVLFFGGTAFIRGTFSCKYCRQKEIGCPAYEIFNKKKR
jgi:hypothetical protein